MFRENARPSWVQDLGQTNRNLLGESEKPIAESIRPVVKAETPPHDLGPPRILVLLAQGEVGVGSTLLDPAGVISGLLLHICPPEHGTAKGRHQDVLGSLSETAVLTCPPVFCCCAPGLLWVVSRLHPDACTQSWRMKKTCSPGSWPC